MTRRLLLVALAACGHSASHAVEAVTVAPRPVAAPPIVVEGEASRGTEDGVAPLEIAIGADAICVRLDGRVHCDVDAPADAPVAAWPTLPGIEDAISLSVARTTGCAATRSGAVFCFGDNGSGQLGAGLRDERKDEPVRVAGITTARKVLAGDAHACAVLADATVRCWGENRNGETGGTTSYAAAARELVTPSVVPGLTDVVDVALTYGSTCARTRTGDVHCWGSSLSPEQQKARGANDENPFRLPSLAKTEDLAGGGGAYCAVRANGVTCFGSSYALGTHNAVHGATKVRIGGSHACALTRDARVWCWGFNTSGELGRDDERGHGYEPYEAAVVAGLPAVRDLAVGGAMSCAIASSDEVWCWGTWPYNRRRAQRIERSPVRVPIR